MKSSSIGTCICLAGPLLVATCFIAYILLYSQLNWGRNSEYPVADRYSEDEMSPLALATSEDNNYDIHAYSNQAFQSAHLDRSKYNLVHFMERRNKKVTLLETLKNRPGSVHVYTSKTTALRGNCVPFKTATKNSRLCVHEKRNDRFISSHIRDTGTWEPDLIGSMTTTLASFPDMHFVDIGCHVGTYTMNAALMGRKVLAIDPIRTNLFLLHSSLVYSGLRNNVTLLLNAISDHKEMVKIVYNKDNPGGSFIRQLVSTDIHVDIKRTLDDSIVNAITLNDLVGITDFRKVLVKMDIEGHEVNALRQSAKFFKHFDVKFIMMEWMLQRNSANGRESIKILTRLGYFPFSSLNRPYDRLNTDNYSSWPDNIVWMKKSTHSVS